MKILLIDLAFESEEGPFRIPRVNLHLFQAMLYNLLPRAFARFLHDRGFESDNRHFKLFAFSWPRGEGKTLFIDDNLVFKPPIRITIATPIRHTISGIADGVLGNPAIRVGNNMLFCSGISLRNPKVEKDEISVYTLSPVTCYSTLYKITGEPYTVYHSPSETPFSEQIHANLARKFTVLNNEMPLPEGKVSLVPSGNIREQIARFRPDDPRPIKGWWGRFILRGPKELLQTALDCGLGAKNSAGFGCIETSRNN